ncbi:MAG: tetratricopeptide repeat protein [Candidatus Altiarchaeota archaeon]|nr:tetratricopeptide repeat protein [Candidatus Altiarchaeota archaeon]
MAEQKVLKVMKTHTDGRMLEELPDVKAAVTGDTLTLESKGLPGEKVVVRLTGGRPAGESLSRRQLDERLPKLLAGTVILGDKEHDRYTVLKTESPDTPGSIRSVSEGHIHPIIHTYVGPSEIGERVDDLLAANKPADALAVLDANSEGMPSDRETQYGLNVMYGRCHLDLGNIDAAEERFMAAVNLDAKKADGLYWIGEAFSKRGNANAALSFMRMALNRDTQDPDIYHMVGIYLMENRDYKNSENALNKAIGINGENADYHDALGDLYLRWDAPKKAIGPYSRAIMLAPNASMFANLGVAYQQTGAEGKAADCYERALSMEPNMPEAHYNLSMIYFGREDGEKSLAHARKALELAPDDLGYIWNVGVNLTYQKKYDEAITLYQHAREISPQTDWVHNDLGILYFQTGRFDESLASAQKAVECGPEDFSNWENLGKSLSAKSMFEEAKDAYGKAMKLCQEPEDLDRIFKAMRRIVERPGR